MFPGLLLESSPERLMDPCRPLQTIATPGSLACAPPLPPPLPRGEKKTSLPGDSSSYAHGITRPCVRALVRKVSILKALRSVPLFAQNSPERVTPGAFSGRSSRGVAERSRPGRRGGAPSAHGKAAKHVNLKNFQVYMSVLLDLYTVYLTGACCSCVRCCAGQRFMVRSTSTKHVDLPARD